MRQIAWPNLPPKLEEAWHRFRALSWKRKAPALSLAALCALGVALFVVAVAGGGGDAGPAGGPGVRHGRATFALTPSPAAAPTPTPTAVPTPTPTPSPNPAGGNTPPAGGATPSSVPTEPPPPAPPPPAATPVAGAYALAGALPSANWDLMVGFAAVPGAPNEAAVITQKTGEVWKVYVGGGAPVKMGDLSSLMASSLAVEEGLLGIAFSPNFQSDRRIYLYYTADDGCSADFDQCSVVSRFTVNGNAINLASKQEVLRVDQPYDNHNGGHLVFGPDGLLYVGLGDGGSGGDPQGHGQNPDLLGSIARVNVSGNGPFSPQVFAIGLRNPWRFSFDRVTGQLWAGDVGQNAWEEVDHIVSGGNYGWNIMEGNACYNPPSGCSTSGLQMPRAVYGHNEGCSVTGGYVYRGPSMPELDGWYVYADFCSGKIWAVNTVGSAPPVQLLDSDVSISSFGELPDGELLVLTFANAVYRLARS